MKGQRHKSSGETVHWNAQPYDPSLSKLRETDNMKRPK